MTEQGWTVGGAGAVRAGWRAPAWGRWVPPVWGESVVQVRRGEYCSAWPGSRGVV